MKDVKALCDQVRQVAYDIHVYHGHGHLEKVYENALAHRLWKAALSVKQQYPFKGRGWNTDRRLLARLTREVQPPSRLSHLLRILGAHLDKNAALTFSIFWTPNSVVVDYKRAGGCTDRLRLSPATIGETIGGGFHRGISVL